MLKAIGHNDDCRRDMSDAEIITTAVCAAMFFNGNQTKGTLALCGNATLLHAIA
uniref:hypothetical protein n=1 Tax=Scytonema sp. HK-05 TaxID=1137095 RepID=UPI001E58775C|nr:hypothetical protein [Scytonema sp. HK-05]